MKINKRYDAYLLLRFSTIGILASVPFFGSAQIVSDGANLKIVCSGSPQIVVTDLSYKNDASSTHFVAGTSKVIFNGNGTATETINSTAGYTTEFGDVTLDRTNGLLLQAPINVTGTLSLTNGLLDIAGYTLNMQANPIVGGSPLSYIKTSGTGTLNRSVGATAVDYPIGAAAYNPARLINTGTADVISLRVVDNVTNDGTALGLTTTEAVVNRTWMIGEEIAGGTNATIRLYWNGAGEEINGFAATNAFMAQYVSASSMWDNLGGSMGTGYIETSNNTALSPFTISSSNTFAPLAINELNFDSFSFTAYPNPSTGNFNVKLEGIALDGNAQLNITDVNGRLMRSMELENSTMVYTISENNLSPGVYYLQIQQGEFKSSVLKHTVH